MTAAADDPTFYCSRHDTVFQLSGLFTRSCYQRGEVCFLESLNDGMSDDLARKINASRSAHPAGGAL